MRFDPGNFIRDNRLWRTHLFHQIVVPLAFDLEMCQRAEFHRFDQHVIEVDVNARLTKSIESGSGASTPYEPRLEVLFRRVMETARFPHIISMAADEMRPAIAVRLGLNNQHGFADLRRESILARERANLALENNMRGNELAHEFECLGKEETRVGEALKFTILAARNIEVVFADVVDAIVRQKLAGFVPEAVARQNHDRTAHPRYNMQRRHRSAWRAMIDEHTGSRCFPAQRGLFAWINLHQRGPPKSSRCRMEVDGVRHRVGRGIDKRHFDIVALMHDHERS